MTQMSTETIIEIETVVDDLTDHEFDICCDLITDGAECDNPARWAGLRSCCGTQALLCTPCKDLRMATESGVYCACCGEVHIPARRIYSYLQPLDGA